MALYVNSNSTSLLTQRYLSKNTDGYTNSLERLATGYRINRAADDAAGLAVSEGLITITRGNSQAMKNIQDGVNMLQIAEGTLDIIGENLQRIRELSVQAANGTYATLERNAMLDEIKERITEITRISETTSYNQVPLLSMDATSIVLQIGTNSSLNSIIDVKNAFGTINSTTLDIELTDVTAEDWKDNATVRAYLDKLDNAIATVSERRSLIGAYQNRIEGAFDNLQVMSENITEANSRIRETDVAAETSTSVKYQILQQTAASVLVQVNQQASVALQLLQG